MAAFMLPLGIPVLAKRRNLYCWHVSLPAETWKCLGGRSRGEIAGRAGKCDNLGEKPDARIQREAQSARSGCISMEHALVDCGGLYAGSHKSRSGEGDTAPSRTLPKRHEHARPDCHDPLTALRVVHL
jgi:hypothetical protein